MEKKEKATSFTTILDGRKNVLRLILFCFSLRKDQFLFILATDNSKSCSR